MCGSSISNSCGWSRSARWRCWWPKTARSKTACSTCRPGLPTSALIEAGNFLNARIRGKTLAELRAEIENALDAGPGRARSADAEDHRRRAGELVGRRKRRAQADRARPRQSARRPACARRSGAGALAVRRAGDQARGDRSARPRRARRRRAHLHRLGEQAVLAVRFLHHRRALSRQRRPHCRRHRRDRPDPAQLCPRHPDGRLHRPGRSSRLAMPV